MTIAEMTEAQYGQQRSLTFEVLAAVLALFLLLERGTRASLIGSWRSQRMTEQMFVAIGTGQLVAATRGAAYVDSLLVEAEGVSTPEGRLDPYRLAGIGSDGRPLESLVLSPLIDELNGLAQGMTPEQAQERGTATLATIARTQVADAGRVAAGVAMAAEPKVTKWVRQLQLPSCGRCAILAGRVYRWSDGFERHPLCDCINKPITESMSGLDRATVDPTAYFDSLSKADQDKYFTKGSAEAIRLGADMNQVVNVRRKAKGIQTAGGVKRIGGRIMPESIIKLADGDRGEAVRLLRRAGYISS